MKRNILTTLGLTTFFILAIVITSSIGNEGVHSVYANVAGSPGNKTGSPSDNFSCVLCHTGSAVNSGTGTPSITAPGLVSGYIPGQTYTISASIVQTGINKFGFEVTAERDANNAKIGTFILTNAANTRFPLGSILTAVTHTNAGSLGTNSKTWSFDWTAPVAGTGDVTFYGSFNSTNGTGQTNGDKIYTTSLSVAENTGAGIGDYNTALNAKVFPNPVVSNFEIVSDENIDAVEVYNLRGQKMIAVNQPNGKVNIETLPGGIYFVKINAEGKVSTQKLIKK